MLALATRIAGVGEVNAISPLLTSEADLVSVDDDDIVAAVYVGSEVGFVLTAQQFGNF